MLSLRKRLPEWAAAVRAAGGSPKWWPMLRALWSGTVPRHVWRARLRVCVRCPIWNKSTKVCRNEALRAGCFCFTPFKALARAPYAEGCYARAIGLTNEGWPAYKKP